MDLSDEADSVPECVVVFETLVEPDSVPDCVGVFDTVEVEEAEAVLLELFDTVVEALPIEFVAV